MFIRFSALSYIIPSYYALMILFLITLTFISLISNLYHFSRSESYRVNALR